MLSSTYNLSDYSVPYTHVCKPLTVRASETEVLLLDGVEQVACHARSWDKGQQLENPEHTRELRERKKVAKTEHATDRLEAACPRIIELLDIVQQRKQGLSKAIKALQSLLDDYGSAEFAAAVSTALDSQTYHVAGIQLVLEQRRESRDQSPLIALSLPQKARAELTQIKTASLADYDQILKRDDTNQQTMTKLHCTFKVIVQDDTRYPTKGVKRFEVSLQKRRHLCIEKVA